MPIDIEEPKVKATKKEIEQLKKEIRELLPTYQTRRLELGMKLLQLQDTLAHHGKGTFTKVAKQELKIPHSTVYDLIDYATAEIKPLERLSGNRTKSDDDITVDLNDPDEMAEMLRKFEEEAMRDNDVAYLNRKPKAPKPFIKQVYLRFIYPRETRLSDEVERGVH